MSSFQYKSGTWQDVPSYAHPDYEGSVMVVYPEAAERDGLGNPCGAIGLPHIEIQARLMRGDGWAWWQAFFASSTQLTATLPGITAYDPRTGVWGHYIGTLLRPTVGITQPGGSASNTLCRDVNIVIENCTAITGAPMYYIDAVGGSDSNSGLLITAPFKTLGALPGSLVADTEINLKRGSHWREQLTLTADNVTVQAYGAGAAPLLDCSDVISPAAWSKTGGRTYVYEATVPLDTVANGWVRAWEDDAHLVRATSVANCDATTGSYFPSADAGASITLYIHATDGGNPASNGKVYEYSARQAGIMARTATNLNLNGLATRRNYHNDGSIIVGPFAQVYNCTASEGSKHNVLCERGSYLYNVLADNSYYGGQPSSMFVYNTDTANGEDVTFVNCTAQNDALVADALGFYGHSNSGGNFGTVLFQDCVASNCGLALDGAYTDIFRVDGLITTGCTLALRPSGVDVGLWDIGGIAHVGGGGAPDNNPVIRLETVATVDLHDCTITPAEATNNTIYVAAAGDFTIRDSTFHCTDAVGWPILMQCTAGAAGAVLDFQGNTFIGYKAWLYYLPAAVTVTSDYNTFDSAADNFHLNGTTYNSLAAWQAAGYDANSTSV